MKVLKKLNRALRPRYYSLKDQNHSLKDQNKKLKERSRSSRQIKKKGPLSIEALKRHWFDGPFYQNMGFSDGFDPSLFTRRLPQDIPRSEDRRKLLLFARSGTAHFFDPVAAALRNDFEIFYAPCFDETAVDQLTDKDVVWLEWGTSVPILDRLNETPALVVLRLHDFEIREEELIANGDWSRADRLIFINENARQDFLAATSEHELKDKTLVIPNVVDERQFPLLPTLGCLRILIVCDKISERKGISRALRMFRALRAVDPRFTLTIRTSVRKSAFAVEEVINEIIKLGLSECVTIALRDGLVPNRITEKISHFQINIKVEMVAEYSRHDIVWSPSYHEGFHYVVAEAMLSGLLPVVIKWDWGDPSQFWDPFVAQNEQDFVEDTLKIGRLSDREREEAREFARSYVVDNFGLQAGRNRLLSAFAFASTTLARRRRIIVFAHNHLYTKNPRGGERSTAAIVAFLKEIGFDVLVLVADRKGVGYERKEHHGISVITVDHKHYKTFAIEIMRWWMPDVAIVWELPARDVWDVCVSCSCPYVLFIRYWHLVAPPPYENLLEQEIDEVFNREVRPIFKFASEVITNCDHAGSVIKRHFDVSTTTAYVPVDATQKQPTQFSDRRYITLINPKKTEGADDLVYALAETMPDLDFLVFQGDPDRCRSKNVLHREYSNEDYGDFLSETLIFLFPFKGEPCGTGRVVYECNSLGIPVLGSRRGGLPEVIPEKYLLDDATDVSKWSAAIRDTIEDYQNAVQDAQMEWKKYDLQAELEIVRDAIEKAIENGSVMKRAATPDLIPSPAKITCVI